MAALTTYRRTIAPLLGVYEQGTADSGANSTSLLVCTTSLASGAQMKSTVFPVSLFAGKWLYMPGAAADNKSRLIASEESGGYDPTNGYLVPDKAWSVDPDNLSDRTFEISSLFSGTDLNTLVNDALKQMYVLRDLTFTASSNNITKHQLNASASWLHEPHWVYQLGHLQSGESWTGTSTLVGVDPYRRVRHGKVYKRGEQIWLEGPTWNSTDTVYALCACRAYDFCKASGGSFGDQSGLSAETDEAPVDAEWLAWCAIIEARKRLEYLERVGQATQESMRARSMAAAEVSRLSRIYWQEPDRTLRPPLTWIGTTRKRAVRW